jgi:probable HAF family extracellular repeat protein
VRWRNGTAPQDLGTLGGANSAIAWPNRNEAGIMAGVSETSTPQPNGESWSCALAVFFLAPPTGNVCLGFVWKNGTMSPLPTLGGDNGFATGVNERGQVVGWAETPVHDPTCASPQVLQFEAVEWDPNGKPVELPPIEGDPDGAATAINARGQAVGISGICSNAIGGLSATHMVLWQNGTATDLGSLGGIAWNTPMDISEKGDVTGFSDLPGDGGDSPNFHAFFWTPRGGVQDLNTLPGDTISEGLGINDKDQVVGVSYPSSHAVIWQSGTMTDLNSLAAPGTTLVLIAAQEINDSGVITGQAQDPSTGAFSAFVAVPRSN